MEHDIRRGSWPLPLRRHVRGATERRRPEAPATVYTVTRATATRAGDGTVSTVTTSSTTAAASLGSQIAVDLASASGSDPGVVSVTFTVTDVVSGVTYAAGPVVLQRA